MVFTGGESLGEILLYNVKNREIESGLIKKCPKVVILKHWAPYFG